LAVGAYAIINYTARPLGAGVHPDMRAVYEARPVPILTHIFCSSLAIILGPIQFIPGIRRRWPAAHRWAGRIYLGVGVLIGGLAALYIAPFAFGGLVSTTGFAALALAWLYTGARAYATARARDFPAHRRWMIRNFAITLAAVTLRIGLGVGFATGLPFEIFYPVLAWVSWIPNVAVAEWMIRRERATTPRAISAA
ncbi:MAG: DUF2306 domain-containing protein, partial [Phycisphaerales bacterium]|nr:DUF2306 domain-containing protein [Phycisphaerales bacterium]